MASKKNSDRPYLWMGRQGRGLVAATSFDADILERFAVGSKVIVTIEQPRDEVLNRRFHGLINTVAKGIHEDPVSLRGRLIIKAGYFDTIDYTSEGVQRLKPREVSSMGQDEYQDLFWRVTEIILTEYLPDMDREELVDLVHKYIGVNR